jgi:pimeloyl-ACP methyl ester carboxylesterase
MRRTLILVFLVLAMPLHTAMAAERWEALPPTPAPLPGLQTGHAELNGIRLFYAEIGQGSPVVVLHGGLPNSDYLGNQVLALSGHHRVVVVDSRGHGRSTRNDQPFGYDLMTDDVVALLDRLNIQKADIVGWSDGAIIGLDMAMRHPNRVGRIFAFGVNTQTSGLKDGFDRNPVFAAYMMRARQEYAHLSSTPDQYDAFQEQIGKMWENQPNWTDAQLRTIRSPVLVVDGDHDEGIKREHTEYIAATIPGARLLIPPNASHFAFLQDPVLFNAALLDFLGDR